MIVPTAYPKVKKCNCWWNVFTCFDKYLPMNNSKAYINKSKNGNKYTIKNNDDELSRLFKYILYNTGKPTTWIE